MAPFFPSCWSRYSVDFILWEIHCLIQTVPFLQFLRTWAWLVTLKGINVYLIYIPSKFWRIRFKHLVSAIKITMILFKLQLLWRRQNIHQIHCKRQNLCIYTEWESGREENVEKRRNTWKTPDRSIDRKYNTRRTQYQKP